MQQIAARFTSFAEAGGETTMIKMSGGQALMQALLREGVDTIFGYPGGAIMPAYDALYDFRDRLRHVLVRHEQGAAHAAEGYARITGRAGVCIATSGPGATNLVTGIADANMDSVPLVCITGQVGSFLLGTDAFQEADVIGITMPITKWNYQVTKASDIPHIIAKAFDIALNGRPGPVLIDITKDAQVEMHEYAWSDHPPVRYASLRVVPERRKLAQAAELINKAKSPLLLVGHGVLIAHAENETRQLIEKTGMPVASTLLGLSAVPTAHPLYVGMLGMHGNYGPNLLTNEADLIIGCGMRFDDRVTGKLQHYASKAKIIHIDVDPAEIGKLVHVDVGICADVREALTALLPLLEQRSHLQWLEKFKHCAQIEFEKVVTHDLHPGKGMLRMGEVIDQLSEKTAGDAVVVADVGQHQMFAARYYRFKQPHSYITSGGLGTMGFALPAAMGVAVADPRRPVLAVVGDGGFQMTIQELGTIAQEKLPVKIVVLNNSFLGMVRQWQELFFEKRYSFTHMQNPDFVKIADGYGIKGEAVVSREQLDAALQRMLAYPGPYLLNITVEEEANVFPMVPAGAGVHEVRLE